MTENLTGEWGQGKALFGVMRGCFLSGNPQEEGKELLYSALPLPHYLELSSGLKSFLRLVSWALPCAVCPLAILSSGIP